MPIVPFQIENQEITLLGSLYTKEETNLTKNMASNKQAPGGDVEEMDTQEDQEMTVNGTKLKYIEKVYTKYTQIIAG